MNFKAAKITAIVLCFVFVFVLPIHAQSDALTLENIYSKGAFRSKGFGPVRWMKDSKGYSTVEKNNALAGEDGKRDPSKNFSKERLN